MEKYFLSHQLIDSGKLCPAIIACKNVAHVVADSNDLCEH